MDMMDMVPILGFSLRGNFVYFSLFFIWYSHREINDKYNYHSSTWIIHPHWFSWGEANQFSLIHPHPPALQTGSIVFGSHGRHHRNVVEGVLNLTENAADCWGNQKEHVRRESFRDFSLHSLAIIKAKSHTLPKSS
jgi:hypothetical protein